MKPILRNQSQWLFWKRFQPNRPLRIRPAAPLNLVFRPTRVGAQLKTYECKTD